MKRFAITVALLAVAVVIGWSGSSALRSADTKEAAVGVAPPGIEKGVKVFVHYAGRADEVWEVKEVKGNWVRIGFAGKDYWANFDNVVYYSF